MIHSKTKTSFYRRLYVAYLIDQGINNVPAITQATGMHRRVAQDTIAALHELRIDCEYIGPKLGGNYVINDWGFIDKSLVKKNAKHISGVLGYAHIKPV